MTSAGRSPIEFVPRARDQVETAFLPPEAVLFDVETSVVYRLNPSASAVWLLIDGERSLHDIATDLSEIAGLSTGVLLRDVESAVEHFADQHLLVGTVEGPDAREELTVLTPPPDP